MRSSSRRLLGPLASTNGPGGAQLVREFMKDYVARSEAERAHYAWFRRQVAIGQADVAAGRVLPDDEVEAHFAARRQPIER